VEIADVGRRERILAAGGMPLDSAFIFGGGSGIGSNNWVVSGERTASGRALLANDPHLSIGMPSIWYEIGLHCQPVNQSCPIDVAGFAFAPSPAVIIGHNGRIAWGVTNVGPDTQDLYRIQVNPENELQYRWNDEWRDFVVHEEILSFGDGVESVAFRVRETHLGPIINDNPIDEDTGEILGFNNHDPLALRWTSLDPGTLWQAVMGINTAQDWESFREALRSWDSPSQNFVYADVEGNIGYQTPGNFPIRAPGEDGMTPSDCADDSCVWQGYIPFDALPSVFNPERGYIVTANQALVPPGYYDLLAETLGGESEQYVMSRDWDAGWRGARINELVAASSAHTPDSMAAIQGDNKLMIAEQFTPYLRDLELADAGQVGVRDWMLEWDYQLHRDSARGAYWMLFLKHLTHDTFDDQLAPLGEAYEGAARELLALGQLLETPDSPWWDDVTTSGVVETPDQLIARALVEALAEAESRLGTNREEWRWGALHTTTFESNPLGLSGIDLIEQLVNRGPFPTSGGRVAPNATTWAFASREFVVRSAPSMRMILDVGAFDNSLASKTTGQSGHPFSPHYDDMIEDWLAIRYHPLHWSREAVEGAGVATLVLLPSAPT
jgi:penicillin amidase